MIYAKNISFEIDGNTIFSDFSFKLDEGKIVLRGENGSGKSSLLGLLCGFLKPTKGQIIRDKNLKIGYLFQDSLDQFIAPIVIEDVAFSLLAKNESNPKKKAMDMLEKLQIPHLAQKSIYSLSGGEKRLVALAGVLCLDCDVFLLDEPLNELDTMHQDLVKEILNSKQATFLVSDHGLLDWENQFYINDK